MRSDDFAATSRGRLVPTSEGVLAFVPDALPPLVELDAETVYVLDQASRAVAELSGAGELLPNPFLLIEPFLRREAVLSSRIEGTQASLPDLYIYEASGEARTPDTREVVNYVRAMAHGQQRLATLPISARLIRELHATLMEGVRGEEKRPGELRDRQVYIAPEGVPIADATFVPAPHTMVPDLLSGWERFVHDDSPMPPLIRCALMHYQFETIHPFNDGNGRIGRLLIPLFLLERGVLRQPLLYLSAYFERDRGAYYDHLFRVSATGDWRPWLHYFLRGAQEIATDALRRVRDLRDLHNAYRERMRGQYTSANAVRLVDELLFYPIVTAPNVARQLGLTPAGARQLVERLCRLNILMPLGQGRPQLYAAQEILDLLE